MPVDQKNLRRLRKVAVEFRRMMLRVENTKTTVWLRLDQTDPKNRKVVFCRKGEEFPVLVPDMAALMEMGAGEVMNLVPEKWEATEATES